MCFFFLKSRIVSIATEQEHFLSSQKNIKEFKYMICLNFNKFINKRKMRTDMHGKSFCIIFNS